MKAKRASLAGAVGAGILLAACQGGGTATPTPAPTAVPSVVPTPTSTPIASPTIPRLGAGNRGEAGTYRTYQSDPQVLVTLPEGWGLYFDETNGTYLNLVRAELLVGKSSDVIDPETHKRAPNPADVMAWLVAHPQLHATDPVPVVISGYEASYVEVEPTTSVDVFYDPLGNFHVGPGHMARFYVIPWDGPDLFIAVLKPPAWSFEDALTVGVPVAESVEFVE